MSVTCLYLHSRKLRKERHEVGLLRFFTRHRYPDGGSDPYGSGASFRYGAGGIVRGGTSALELRGSHILRYIRLFPGGEAVGYERRGLCLLAASDPQGLCPGVGVVAPLSVPPYARGERRPERLGAVFRMRV